MEIITRAEAKKSGLKHYFTGQPCVRGHIDRRFVSIGKCMACAREDAAKKHVHTTKKRRAYNDLKSFIMSAKAIHEEKYTYERAVYKNAHSKLEITCPLHGVFMQSPTNHIQGKGCPKCKFERFEICRPMEHEEFVVKAKAIFGDSFSYDKSTYTAAHTDITITCNKHNEDFSQRPTNHLSGKVSCPKCNHMKSSQEDALYSFLKNFTSAEQRNRTIIRPKEIDIYLPDHKIGIEYCGMYWHAHWNKEDEKKNKLKHFNKYQLCQEKGVRLITVYESEWQENPYAIKRLLRNAIAKSRGKVMARKCDLRPVEHQEALAFYNKYHPQGGAGRGYHYGLYWKNKLVACMRFTMGSNDRGHGAKNREWTLSRYATRVTVTGGASRLFKAFVKEHNPESVKSFSDNRYFGGGMYEQLGFVLEEEVAPDYQVWSPKIGLRPKPHYQRRVLQKRLEEHGVEDGFDHETDPRTEAEMTYLMGAARIYDCGKKRWLWTP